MKTIDRLFQFIQENCTFSDIQTAVQEGKPPGIHAEYIQQHLGIVRNNASTLLNQLHKQGVLIKISSRPVMFLPREIFENFCQAAQIPCKTTYAPDELHKWKKKEMSSRDDPFEKLLGKNSSLSNPISQAAAAIVYPPKGLHTLIIGASGVGKTTFAATMHAYGLYIHKKTPDQFPFITFNCTDYFNNPQLLLSQLFGHTKNAFTGAGQEKEGLVAKANGGILFLDEIHRLPPDGQEMLFYLMDKGEYSRLGESSARQKTDILLIGATTETPDDKLLATFMRRIPVTIALPTFSQKPVAERIEIIEHFFHCEAVNLNHPIELPPETLKALAVYDFQKGNIGQLRSEIKLLCAKAFLQFLQDNQSITIHFSLLNKEIKAGIFAFDRLNPETRQYLNMFSENILLTPQKRQSTDPLALPTELYDQMAIKMTDLRQQGLEQTKIQEVLAKDVDTYFSGILKNIHSKAGDISTLYKLIPQNIVDFTAQMVAFAEHHLSEKFKEKFIFGLSFHIQALLNRHNTNPVLPMPQISKIRQKFPKEYQIAQEMVKKLEATFQVSIPSYEQGFLALLLAQNKQNTSTKELIGLLIICHGDSTASSIANVANTLLNTSWMKAVDMPLTTSIQETYDKVRSIALSINQKKGILLLVDMGSLADFGHRLMEDTGIPAQVIDHISTADALEILRKVLYKTDDLTALYASCKNMHLPDKQPASNKQPAILAVCITGQGSSLMVKEIIEKMLPAAYKKIFSIIVSDYLSIQHKFKELSQTYEFAAVVGNVDPQLNLPYFPIGQLLEADAQQKFFNLLDIQKTNQSDVPAAADIYEKSLHLLEQYVKYVNPKIALRYIKDFIETIGYHPSTEDQGLDLIIHLGCMLDRCLHKDAIYFENIRSFRQENETAFSKIRVAADILAKAYDTSINDDEVCYIVKILQTQK